MPSRELASPLPSLLQFLRDELTPLSPARWSRTLRMTAVVMVVTIVSMALRVPEASLSAYMIFFFSKADSAATLRTAAGGVVGLTLAIALIFVLYLTTFTEPALRVPAMACIVFVGMYIVRSSPAGPLGWLFALVTGYAATLPDAGTPPEVLTRAILWLWVALIYPIALLALADAVAGQRRADIFRQGVAARLEAVGAYLRGGAGVDVPARKRVEHLKRTGTRDLSPHVEDRSPSIAAARARVVQQLELLFLLLRELPVDAKRSPQVHDALAAAGDVCLSLSRVVLRADGAPPPLRADLADRGVRDGASPAALAVVLPLLRCVEDVAIAALAARQPIRSPVPGDAPEEERPRATPATSSKTDSVRFALKVTLAAMTAYILYSSLAWPGIHTAMLTCIIVAQDSVGATIHKLTLRIAGALVGAALGIGAILVVLPRLESAGGLAVLVGAVTLLAAWIATGSDAISYAGFQVAFTFYLTVLQGFSRTSNIVVARDRVLGILLGNLLMTVVFTHLWPVRIGSSIRQALSRAAEALAAALRSEPEQAGGSALRDAEAAFHASVRIAAQAGPMQNMERGEDDGTSFLPLIERLFVRIHAIAHQPIDLQGLPPAMTAALSALGESVASWLSELAKAIAARGAAPVFRPAEGAVAELERFMASGQELDAAVTPVRLRVAWFGLLCDDLRRFPVHRLIPLRTPT